MDCLEGMKLIPDNSIDLVVTDPPYKTTSRGSSGGTGGILKDELNKKGMVFEHNNIKFYEWLPELYRVLKESCHAYIMTNNKNLKDMLIEIENAGFSIYKTLIWAKNSPITNMYYMDSHEYIVFCRKGKAKRINNCGTKSVLNIDNPRNKLHPTEKPIELMKIFIENSSNENEIVLDPFMGVGSTALACKESNRQFIGFELDKHYCDIANERINAFMVRRRSKRVSKLAKISRQPVRPIRIRACAWCEKDEMLIPLQDCMGCSHNRQDGMKVLCSWAPAEKPCEG